MHLTRIVILVAALTAAAGRFFVGSAQDWQWEAIVRSETGSPVGHAVVTALIRTGTTTTARSSTTDTSGRFSLRLPSGPTDITVRARGYSAWLKRVVTSGDVAVDDQITLRPAATLSGKLKYFDGSSAPGIFVEIAYDQSRLAFVPPMDIHGGARLSAADGSFRIVNVMADVPFRIELSADDALLGRFAPYTLSSGASGVVDLTLPSLGRLHGVVESRSGAAIGDAAVRLVRTESNSDNYVAIRLMALATRTSEHGSFVFPPMMSGHFRLVVSKPGFSTEVVATSIDVAGGSSTARVVLEPR